MKPVVADPSLRHPSDKDRSQKPFQERRPLFEVVADRALDGVDAPPSCLPQDKCGLIFHGLSAHVLCLSHRGVGDVSPKTSLVRLCLRLFSSHKVHSAHSRAPAVFKGRSLCQCCCTTHRCKTWNARSARRDDR